MYTADGNHDMKYDKYCRVSLVELDRIPAYLCWANPLNWPLGCHEHESRGLSTLDIGVMSFCVAHVTS